MVKCSSCGTDNPETHKHCHSCGAPLSVQPVGRAQIQAMIDGALEHRTAKIMTEHMEEVVENARERVTAGMGKLVDDARDRIMSWLKQLLIPAVFIAGMAAAALGLFGFDRLSAVDDKLTKAQEEIDKATKKAQDAFAKLENVTTKMPAQAEDIKKKLDGLLAQYALLDIAATRPILVELAFTDMFFEAFLTYVTSSFSNDKVSKLSITVYRPDEFEKSFKSIQTWAVLKLDSHEIIVSQISISKPIEALENVCTVLLEAIAPPPDEEKTKVFLADPMNAIIRQAIPRYIVASYLGKNSGVEKEKVSLPRNTGRASTTEADMEARERYRQDQEQRAKIDNLVAAFDKVASNAGVGQSLVIDIVLRAWEKSHQVQLKGASSWSDAFFNSLLAQGKTVLVEKKAKLKPEETLQDMRKILMNRGFLPHQESSR
jgi:hypothetical protein